MPLPPNSNIHNYETRTRHHIYQSKTKYEYAKHCIRFHIPKTINNSPNSILDKINTHGLKSFSGYIKICFRQAYQETCTILIFFFFFFKFYIFQMIIMCICFVHFRQVMYVVSTTKHVVRN